MIKATFGAIPDPQTEYSNRDAPTTAAPRGGNFAQGAQSSEGLQGQQQRYDDLVPKAYSNAASVLQRGSNIPSALSVGLSPNDQRSSVFNGQRYVQTSPVGRSQSTIAAEPKFAGTPGASQPPGPSQSLSQQFGQHRPGQ